MRTKFKVAALLLAAVFAAVPYVVQAVNLPAFYQFEDSGDIGNFSLVNVAAGETEILVDTAPGDAGFGKSMKIQGLGSKNTEARLAIGNQDAAIEVAFSAYRSDKNSQLRSNIRGNDAAGTLLGAVATVVFDTDGKVKMVGDDTGFVYNTATWYDVKYIINLKHKFYKLYIKESGSTDWDFVTYKSSKRTAVFSPANIHTIFFGISLGTEMTTNYIDNVSVGLSDNGYPEYAYNLKSEHYFESSDITLSNLPSGFTSQNVLSGVTSLDTVSVAGRDGLSLRMTGNNFSGSGQVTNFFQILNIPSPSAALDALIRLRVKMGVEDTASRNCLQLRFTDINNPGTYVAAFRDVIIFEEGNVMLAPNKVLFEYLPGVLYDFDILYDYENEIFVLTALDGDGNQIIENVSSWNFEGLLQTVCLLARTTVSTSNTALAHTSLLADDLIWKTVDSFKVVGTSPEVDEDSAPLNSEIKINYNAAVNGETLKNADISVTNGDDNVPIDDVTLTSDGIVIELAEKLSAHKEYTINVSGVQSVLGDTADDLEFSFTSASTVTATIPRFTISGSPASSLSNSVIKVASNHKSGTGENEDVMLVAVLYEKDTNLIKEVYAKTDTATTIEKEIYVEADLTGGASNCKLEAYIWSGFGTMTPYVVKSVLN